MQPQNPLEARTHDELITSLRAAAQRIAGQRSIRDLQVTLAQIVEAAVDTVPGAVAGGVSMTENGGVGSEAPSSEDIAKLDRLQSELNEGPCISAVLDPPATGIVLAEDLASDGDASRWPRFAPAAVAAGYRSLMSTQLSADGGRRAALNLYAHDPGAFDVQAQLTAGLFGVQAALLLYGADHAAALNRALETRDVIGQAKGILVERFTVSDDEAFQMLVSSSQDTNVKLVDVARFLTGEAAARRATRPPPEHR